VIVDHAESTGPRQEVDRSTRSEEVSRYRETIPPLLDRASPLRSAHLRDPVGPQIHFASKSFIGSRGTEADSG
jgi:hypothetical protein